MTPEQRNKIIHAAMEKCWHEDDGLTARLVCKKCKLSTLNPDCFRNPDYTSSWKAWGPVLEWAKASEWFDDFIKWLISENDLWDAESAVIVILDLLTCLDCDGEHGAGILAEYIIAHPEHFGKED